MKLALATLTALALASCATSRATHRSYSAGTTPDPRFERFLALEGDWYAVDEDGEPTDQLMTSYEVTAGGSAVLERVFPGSPSEMVTLYHLDNGQLMLTHYCAAGNQPTMRALPCESRPPGVEEEVFFHCAGGTNMRSEEDGHMHDATFRFLGPERFEAIWVYHEGGKQPEEVHMDLVRLQTLGYWEGATDADAE